MLVFLSSAPANRPRYADDIVRVLALPTGAQMQFRYDRRWVSPEVLKRIPREQLANEEILVCFLAGDGGRQPFEIIPIRFARLIRAEFIGTACLFIFEASGFLLPPSDAAVRASVNSKTRRKLPGPSPADEAFYVFDCEGHAQVPPQRPYLEGFEGAVALASKFEPFSRPETVFFTIFRLSRVGKFSWFGSWPRTKSPSRAEMGAFVLASGKRYACEVYCLRPNDPPKGQVHRKVRLEVSSEGEELAFVSATHGDVDSKYDVKRFVFKSDPGLFDRLTGIRFFIRIESDEVHREIEVPIILRPYYLLREVKLTLVGAGAAITGLLAASAAGKLTLYGLTFWLIILGGFLVGVAAVFPSVKKP